MPGDCSKLTIQLRPSEILAVGDVTVELVHKSGQAARLRICAPRAMKITKLSQDGEQDIAQVVPRMAQLTAG